MPRYWFAIITAVIVSAVIAGGMFYVCNCSRKIEQSVQAAEQALEQQKTEYALKLLRQAGERWEKGQALLELLVDHGMVEEVSIPLAEAEAYLEYGQLADCTARCRSLRKILRELRDGQRISFANLF